MMYSAARMDSAMIVSVGFFSLDVVKQLPSVTNKFLTPCDWQKLYNASDVPVKPRIDDPIPEEVFDSLYKHFADFRRAYDEDGMKVEEFDTFGPTVRTLRQFIESYRELTGVVREFMLPNPDIRK